MNGRFSRIATLTGLVFILAGAALAHSGPAGLGKRIDLDLVGAAAVDVFHSFGDITGAEVVLDPALQGEVTIRLSDVSVGTTITALCEMLGCKWDLEEGSPRRLVVKAGTPEEARPAAEEPKGDLDTRVSLSLADAPAEEVLESFAEIGRWKFQFDKPKVTIELRDAPVSEALDEVCAQIGCVWSLDEAGGAGVLRIEFD